MLHANRRFVDVFPLFAILILALPAAAAAGPANPSNAPNVRLKPLAVTKASAPILAQAVVVATNSARLKNQSFVESGDVVVNAAAPGETLQSGYELALDPRATTGAGSDLKASRIWVKNNAVAAGDVAYNTLRNQGSILGTQTTPLGLPVFASLPPFHATVPPPGGVGVTVPAGGYALLPSGAYGAVTVGNGGTLVFGGGAFDLLAVTAADSAQLLFAAPSEVRIAGRLLTGAKAVLGPAPGSGLAEHDLVIYVAGTNGGTGVLTTPLAADFGNNGQVSASVYAPHGTIRLGHAILATGAFLGRDVLAETQAHLVLASYFFNRLPVAVDDHARVAQGGTVSALISGAASVLANDSDPENGVLTVTTTPVAGPSYGTLTLHSDGTFTYVHSGQDTPDDSFVYQVCDDGAPIECATATVTVAVARQIRVEVRAFGLGSGRVFSTPAGIDCGGTCVALFDGTVPIQLTAEAFGSSVFGGFSGDADCVDGTLEPDGDKLCFVRFDASATPATLTVALAGSGSGEVVSVPSGIRCPGTCAAGFPIPTRVELQATPAAGSVFVGWSGDAGCAGGEVALFSDTTCIATFDLLPTPPASYTLTLIFLGGGGGTVTSNPAGVLCERNCTTSFPQGTSLMLFERPLVGTFNSWGGDCSGTDFSTALVLDANKTCTVTFDP